MLRWLILILLLSSKITVVFAQADAQSSDYIIDYNDKFYFWPLLKKRSLSFDVTNTKDKAQSIKYFPNNAFTVGAGIYIFEVAAEISFAVPINEKKVSTYGSTQTRDFRANLVGNHWAFDLYRQRYQGFYYPELINKKEVVYKRPDVELANTGVSGIYALNKNRFSLKAAFNYSQEQLKSSGSPVFSLNLNNFNLEADSSIISGRFIATKPTSDFQKLRITTFALALGYTYTLVYQSFFINGTVALGPSNHWIRYAPPLGSYYFDQDINLYSDIRFSLGYNSDKFFGGISAIAQSRTIQFEDIRFTNSGTSFRIMVGYRFNERGILKKRARDYIPL